jgi:hypothetical protein
VTHGSRSFAFAGMVAMAIVWPGWADEVVVPSKSGRPVLAVQSAPRPNKVYVARLYSPAGVQVLLDAPPDHVHHHGLMFAFDTPEGDFWLDGPNHGVQRSREDPEVGEGVVDQRLDWVAANGTVVLTERRHLKLARDVTPGATVLTWVSRLERPAGWPPLEVKTDRAYVGLGFRLPKSMDRHAVFHFPEGRERRHVRNTEHVTRDRWCAAVGPVAEATVTVVMFDHPDNLRHPAAWFTMSDSLTYMSATLGMDRQPLTLEVGEPLTLMYGIVVWDGAQPPDIVEDAYRRWVRQTSAPAAATKKDEK